MALPDHLHNNERRTFLKRSAILSIGLPFVVASQFSTPALAAPKKNATSVLTEISLVHDNLTAVGIFSDWVLCRILWEPDRYNTAPTEIFLEVIAGLNNPTPVVTFELFDRTNSVVIPGSALVFNDTTRTRKRTGNLRASFPIATAELELRALIASLFNGLTLQRSALLVQLG